MELPKQFSKCPNCESTMRMCSELLKDVPEKALPPGAKGRPLDKVGLFTYPLVIPGFLLPTIYQAVLDVCLDCGTVYAIAIQQVQVKVDAKQMMDPNRGHLGPGLVGPFG